MTATLQDLKDWYEEAKEQGATHLIVACDTFDWDNYPVYVMPEDDVNQKVSEKQGSNMQRVDEVYNMSKPFDKQKKVGNRSWDLG